MMDSSHEIDAALATQDPIPKARVLVWLESAKDLPMLAKLYRLTGEGYYRIQPEFGKETACQAVRNYLLECIRQDVTEDEAIQSRWEAAGTLHLWLRQLLEMGDASDEIEKTAAAVTILFLTGEEAIQVADRARLPGARLGECGSTTALRELVEGRSTPRDLGKGPPVGG